MTLHDILAELGDMGCRVTVRSGQPAVSRPANPEHRERFAVLVPVLKERRDEVLAHFAPDVVEHPGKQCPECRAWRYYDDPLETERFCDRRPQLIRFNYAKKRMLPFAEDTGYCPYKAPRRG